VKRQPLLADFYLATAKKTRIDAPHFVQTTCDHIRQAHRFVLDDDAVRYIGELIRTMPRIIADAQDFAIPPFKQTWIEFNARLLYEVVTGEPSASNSDERVGYLIAGPVARVVAGNPSEANENPVCIQFEYRLFQPWTPQEELDFCHKAHISRLGLDQMFWGAAANQLIEEHDKEGLRALRRNHSIKLQCTKEYEEELVTAMAGSLAGDLRNIIAILLFLNRASKDIYTTEVGRAQTMIGRRAAPLLKHSVIKIKLNPIPRLRKLIAGVGVFRRLHDVRGHFCHNKEARFSGCLHEWEETKPLHWECKLKCGGVRWWRTEHKRGHEEKGIVTSHYQVTE
jgi:hypothetical protein